MKVLKLNVILEPLTVVFKNWSTGEMPEDWRRANIIPNLKQKES